MVIIFLFIFGLLIGSFLNVVVLRLPKEESLLGRSHCVNCNKTLNYFELFPVFSYLFLGGKCSGCQQKISPRYAIIELLVGFMFAVSWLLLKPENIFEYVNFVKIIVGICLFLVIFVVDLENFIILDEIVIFGSIFSLCLAVFLDIFSYMQTNHFQGHVLQSSLFGVLVSFVPFFCLWYFSKGEWLGFGDVKLALFLGLFFGWKLVLFNNFLSIIIGGLVAVWLLSVAGKNLKTKVPFGTFISVASVITLFYGNQILSWYLSYVGV